MVLEKKIMRNSPSWTKPLVLAITLTALGSFAYWTAFKKNPADEEKQEFENRVLPIELEQISQFTIERPIDGKPEKISFVCLTMAEKLCQPGTNSKWEITAPAKFKADDSAVNSFISAMTTWVSPSTIDLSDENQEKRQILFKEYHLDQTSRHAPLTYKIRVETDHGIKSVYFGEKHPLENSLFVGVAQGMGDQEQMNDRKVYLLPEFTLASMEQPLSYWRDKRLLSLTQGTVSNVTIIPSPGKILNLSRLNGLWTVNRDGVSIPGDRDRIDAWISGVLFLNAKGFSKTNTVAGLKQVLEIAITGSGDVKVVRFFTKTFRDGKKTAIQLYAKVHGLDPLYELDTSVLDRLNVQPENFAINRLIFTPDRLKITWFKVGEKIWTKKSDTWKPNDPEKKIEAFLDRISTPVVQNTKPHPLFPGNPAEAFDVQMGTGPENVIAHYVFWQWEGIVLALDKKTDHTVEIAEEAWSLIPHGK